MITTRTNINNQIKIICDITGLTNNSEAAKAKGHKAYLAVDYAPGYGGYRLTMIKVDSGASYGAFGWGSTCTRLTPGIFWEQLDGLIKGLEFNKEAFDQMVLQDNQVY